MRTSQRLITKLKDKEIFVFGSNLSGIHGGGAAKTAYDKFGAVWGCGIGAQGMCYAIPTKSENIERTLTIEEIKPFVDEFISFAALCPKYNYLVTEIGCGLAGLTVEEIAPLFRECLNLENVFLPSRFVKFLTKE